jgi:pimeloyl-ACP methyl ester carboxylesterase
MAARAGEPWFEDSSAALQAEQAGEFETDAELGELALREFKFYFARYGDAEHEYLESLRVDVPNGDTLRYFNKELFETFDLRPQLGEISAPALVVTGEEDFITGPVCANELAECLDDVRKVVIPGAGHFVFVEAPDAFREAVFDFLGV